MRILHKSPMKGKIYKKECSKWFFGGIEGFVFVNPLWLSKLKGCLEKDDDDCEFCNLAPKFGKLKSGKDSGWY